MSTLAGTPTKLPLRSAMEARDLGAAVDAFAPDAVVRSPLTDKLTFNGHEQIGALERGTVGPRRASCRPARWHRTPTRAEMPG